MRRNRLKIMSKRGTGAKTNASNTREEPKDQTKEQKEHEPSCRGHMSTGNMETGEERPNRLKKALDNGQGIRSHLYHLTETE